MVETEEKLDIGDNNLPDELMSSNSLQTFKTKLKSHLFLVSFPYFFLTVNFKESEK